MKPSRPRDGLPETLGLLKPSRVRDGLGRLASGKGQNRWGCWGSKPSRLRDGLGRLEVNATQSKPSPVPPSRGDGSACVGGKTGEGGRWSKPDAERSSCSCRPLRTASGTVR